MMSEMDSASSEESSAGEQFVLDLQRCPAFRRDDFIVSASNRHAVRLVDSWPEWTCPSLLLVGPEGSGKSHLASVWQKKTDGALIDASALMMDSLPDFLEKKYLVIEDVDHPDVDETALFHILNLAREQGVTLLLTARMADISAWVTLDDLRSRLRAVPTAKLGAPDDMLLKAVLFKLLHDRQLLIGSALLDYLIPRMERSFTAAGRIVDELDRRSLAGKRSITRGLAAEIVTDLATSSDDIP